MIRFRDNKHTNLAHSDSWDIMHQLVKGFADAEKETDYPTQDRILPETINPVRTAVAQSKQIISAIRENIKHVFPFSTFKKKRRNKMKSVVHCDEQPHITETNQTLESSLRSRENREGFN